MKAKNISYPVYQSTLRVSFLLQHREEIIQSRVGDRCSGLVKNLSVMSMCVISFEMLREHACWKIWPNGTRRFKFSVVRPYTQAQTLASFESFTFMNKLFHPKASKITITFKNEPDRKSQVSALVISSYYISQLQTTRRPMRTLVNLGLTFGRVVKWKSSLNFVGIIVNDVISTFVRLYLSEAFVQIRVTGRIYESKFITLWS